MLIAINAGARLGVVGEVITIDRENINKDALKDISVKLIDESGEIIAQGNSNALLGDPLNVVFWIKEQLKAQRKTLKKGDLLSLGSITPLIPVEIGKTINAQYTGLEKDQVIEVFITFEWLQPFTLIVKGIIFRQIKMLSMVVHDDHDEGGQN